MLFKLFKHQLLDAEHSQINFKCESLLLSIKDIQPVLQEIAHIKRNDSHVPSCITLEEVTDMLKVSAAMCRDLNVLINGTIADRRNSEVDVKSCTWDERTGASTDCRSIA